MNQPALRRNIVVPLLLAIAALATTSAPGRAEEPDAIEFRVENRVYVADDTQPASKSVTLFADDAVYDFLADTNEVTIFEEAAGRIVLLAPDSDVRTEWQTRQLADFSAQIKQRAKAHKDPVLRFLANPDFKESRGRAGKTVKLDSPMLVYDVTTQRPDDRAAVQRYAEFSDWFAQLNALPNRAGTPPFARMQLNSLLAQVGVLPQEVRKRITSGKKSPTQRLRSTHEVTWSLSAADQRRIDKARAQLATLPAVPHGEYERLTDKRETGTKRR